MKRFKVLLILLGLFLLSSCGSDISYQEQINNYNKFVDKANLLIETGNYREAFPYANSAIEITDTLPSAFVSKGTALYHLSKLKDARKSFDKVIKIEGAKSPAYKSRALVHLKNKNSNFLDDINVYLENYPGDEEAIELRRTYYEDKNDLKNAIREYSTAISSNPDNNDLIFKRAELYFKNKDWDASLKDLETILKLDPNNNFVIGKKREIEKILHNKSKRNNFILFLIGVYLAYLIISLLILRPIISKKIQNQVGGAVSLKGDLLIWLLPILLLLIYVIYYKMDIIPSLNFIS